MQMYVIQSFDIMLKKRYMGNIHDHRKPKNIISTITFGAMSDLHNIAMGLRVRITYVHSHGPF